MYIPDLAPYCYDLPKALEGVLAVGWLNKETPFQSGKCPEDVVKKLERLTLRERVNPMRGTHRCDFCNQDEIKLNVGKHALLLGSAEVWVPDSSGRVVFAAPNLIVHYIMEHKYLPPESFIQAIRNFREESTWSGETLYEKFSRDAYL
jgi:hypothetical protein